MRFDSDNLDVLLHPRQTERFGSDASAHIDDRVTDGRFVFPQEYVLGVGVIVFWGSHVDIGTDDCAAAMAVCPVPVPLDKHWSLVPARRIASCDPTQKLAPPGTVQMVDAQATCLAAAVYLFARSYDSRQVIEATS